jgi:hypothetical protein
VLTPLIMSVAMLIMIPSDWHQDSAVPEIADDEVSAMTAYGVRREKAALSSGCKAHPAIRSSRKQSEQSWR